MQTNFTEAQKRDAAVAASEEILRRCVHCGFCLPSCPTYTLLGDERDSPRGRIYLIKDMLENNRAASDQEALHIDRCLSCLSCMPACPSDVNYQHLIDHARVHVEKTRRRPVLEQALRKVIAFVLPVPGRLRAAMTAAKFALPLAPLLPRQLRAALGLAKKVDIGARTMAVPGIYPAQGTRKMRVALLPGCVQDVMAPGITAAAIRVLTRHGAEVVIPTGLGCCGALEHHLGDDASHRRVKTNTQAIANSETEEKFDAVITTASGCGVMMKDYGFILRNDVQATTASDMSNRVRDITEVLDALGLQVTGETPKAVVAYHAACALQNGMRVSEPPRKLLRTAGFDVREIAEGHMCCGSAGTYNILQPEIATALRDRKAANVNATEAAIVATGNIGCMVQLGGTVTPPVVHTVELLDWATGGPKPASLTT